jgi:hypothetical protein
LFRDDFRQHAIKAVDYSIRVALVSILAVPLCFCVWWGLGSPPGEPGLNPGGDFWAEVVGRIGFVFLSPAYAAVGLLRLLHIPSIFGVLDWVIAFVSVPAFWVTLWHCLLQLFRVARQRLV